MANDRVKEVTLPDGSARNAIEMDFEVVAENWNEYRLADGTRVRVKNIVSKIFVMVDDNGDPVADATGDPEVMVHGAVKIASSAPTEDRP